MARVAVLVESLAVVVEPGAVVEALGEVRDDAGGVVPTGALGVPDDRSVAAVRAGAEVPAADDVELVSPSVDVDVAVAVVGSMGATVVEVPWTSWRCGAGSFRSPCRPSSCKPASGGTVGEGGPVAVPSRPVMVG
jgi:hypothetical protein